MQRPNLYIIAGPNGAGKTTASFSLLPDVLHCLNFVNADEIARGLSPFASESVAFQAGRIMLQRIDELLPQKVDFAIETTLATRSYVHLVHRAQNLGYKVHLIYFYLENEEHSVLIYNNVMTPAKLVARKITKQDDIEAVEPNMWNQLIQKI